MKRTLIGGIIALIGTIWSISVIAFVEANLSSAWSTPPGRFLGTVMETGVTFPTVVAILLTLTGVTMLFVEYFRKDKS